MNQSPIDRVHITHIGGPTTLIEIGPLRILTDPAFDPAGSEYIVGPLKIVKTGDPALSTAEIGPVDIVLLSHDHHIDNLDPAGRAYLPQAQHVLTTPAGTQRLGSTTRGITTWETVELTGSGNTHIRITATPARHGPEEILPLIGDVTGWLIEWNGQQRGALYISGDTVLFEGMKEIAQRYQIGVALLHFGAAHAEPFGPFNLTLTAAEGAEFTKLLGDTTIVPIHYEGWAHFTEGNAEIEQTFATVGLEKLLHFLPFGKPVSIKV